MNSPLRCLLWDFGDTLCDERFIWASGPAWLEIYETFDDGLGTDWCSGAVDTRAFAASIAGHVGLTTEGVIAHMTRRCQLVRWSAHAYAFFRARHLPQAIVTVNPDIFSDVIVPMYGLDHAADVIVTSWEERTNDKGALCAIALDRLGIDATPSEALLIDNRTDCLASWAELGGAGYLFTDDAAFASDVSSGIDSLVSPHSSPW